jgi:TonB-linked SusC/RagA family outer membrane protein
MVRIFAGLAIRLATGVALCAIASVAGAQTQRPVAADVPAKPHRAATMLAQLVTVDVDSVPLRRALDAIARAAQVRLQYPVAKVQQYTRPVTLHLVKVPMAIAFEKALAGTGLRVEPLLDGSLIVTHAAADSVQAGSITGIVTDASTHAPVVGALVSIDSTHASIKTQGRGNFAMTGVRPGPHRVNVRLLGYRPYSTVVTVRAGTAAMLAIALTPSATVLNDVVTTATGQQKRYEVGNDVGTINADSLVQGTLVRNLSDLLTAHTPGVQATPTDGTLGAPTRIRVRGVTSPQLNNDPIVVIDGVRVNAQTTLNTVTYFGSPLPSSQINTGNPQIGTPSMYSSAARAPSPLDQIDPNMIESIDLLKGPTATALYGPDASTGVIVIKTKAGKPGPWRYHLMGDYGWIVPPRTYPLIYTGWGHPPGGGPSTPGCKLVTFYDAYEASQANGGCLFDSVTAFNPQNDPQMTTLGTGYNRSVVMDASGGGSTVQGFIQGDYSDAVGQQRLSLVEQRRLARMWATPVPSWLKRPNGQTNVHVMSKVSAHFTPNFDIAATGQGTYQVTRNDGTGLGTWGDEYGNPYGPGDTLTYLPGEHLTRRVTSSTKRGLGTGNLRYQPLAWLVLTGTGGLDYSLRDDQTLQRAQDCTAELSWSGCAGSTSHSDTRTEVLVPSFTVGATFTYDLAHWLQAHTSFGEQYSRTQSYIMGVSASGLALGQNLITGATYINTPTEVSDEAASAGWYAEQQLAFNQRLFLTAALRRDASSAFGESIATPTFPKYGASWVVSNEPFFPHQNVLTQLRLRAAYGESGKQGSQTDVLRSFLYTSGVTPEGEIGPAVLLSGLGNPHLQPQRDQEWEGGFDLSLYNDRATVTATWYRKQSNNAIISINVPPSPGAVMPIQAQNVGAIRNTGYELQLSLRPVDTKLMTWDFNFQASHNNNILLDNGSLVNLPANSGGIIRAGYPLFGFWQRPVLAYGDYDGNGILEPSEVAVGDSQVFMGSANPSGTFAYANSLTFLGGRLRFNSMFNQVTGMGTRLNVRTTRGMVDPTSSIAEQAAAIQASDFGYLATVSYVRLAELSGSYTLPARLARQLRSQSVTITVAGRNLALWSNYRGKDPTTSNVVFGGVGDASVDDGSGMAQPRNWVVRFNVQF